MTNKSTTLEIPAQMSARLNTISQALLMVAAAEKMIATAFADELENDGTQRSSSVHILFADDTAEMEYKDTIADSCDNASTSLQGTKEKLMALQSDVLYFLSYPAEFTPTPIADGTPTYTIAVENTTHLKP